MFREGKGVLKDDKSALEWFLSSGRQGFAPAQHYLGLVYEKGVGVEIDYVRSGKWFYQGAQSMKSLNRDAHRGNAESQYHLGLLLVEMKKKQDNLAKGLHWMVRAEENGYIEAKLERLWVESRFTEQMKRERKLIAKTYFSLGLFFETEWKGGNNVGLALKWLGYAEKVGYPYAKYKAWLVRGRHEGLPEFYLQTVQWYLDLLTQGNKKISKTVVNKIVPEPVKVGVKVSASSYMNPKANRGFSQLWYSRVPFQSPEWLQADYIKPVRLQRFGFQAQADGPDFSSHKRAPKVFQLIASNDQKIWEVLLSVDDAEFEGSFQGLWKIWSFENYKFFKHYRFIMYANNGDPGLLSVQSWSLAE